MGCVFSALDTDTGSNTLAPMVKTGGRDYETYSSRERRRTGDGRLDRLGQCGRPASADVHQGTVDAAPYYNWTGLLCRYQRRRRLGHRRAGTAPAASTRRAAWSAARSATTGSSAPGCSASKATSTGPTSRAARVRAACPGGCSTENTWLGTARGRVGYAFDRWMPYITGGAAFGDVTANHPGFTGASNTQVGWAAGAGVEFAVVNNWTAKVEYLHYDLGSFNCGLKLQRLRRRQREASMPTRSVAASTSASDRRTARPAKGPGPQGPGPFVFRKLLDAGPVAHRMGARAFRQPEDRAVRTAGWPRRPAPPPQTHRGTATRRG